MIINALCEYYDILAADEKSGIAPLGYEKNYFSYEIVISENGELRSIIFLDEPKSDIMPNTMRTRSSKPSPTLFCDTADYLLGVSDGIEKGKNALTSKEKFEAEKQLHIRLLKNATSKEAVAIRRFFEKWDVNQANSNKEVLERIKDKNNSFFNRKLVFRLELTPYNLCDEIRCIWLKENENKESKTEKLVGQCAITGNTNVPIARTHNAIKAASLVSFDKGSPAYSSYNLTESYNSRVSKTAMAKYTTVLNDMLKSRDNQLYIPGYNTTTVFWATSGYHKVYEEFISNFFNYEEDNDKVEVDKRTQSLILSSLEQVVKGIMPADIPNYDPNVRFYILGIDIPQKGRVSVRYFYQNTFAEFCEKIKRYYEETHICGKQKYIKIGSLLYSTISTNSSDKKINPLLGGAIMRALLSGSNYPQLLLNQVVMRVKAEKSVSQARAAAIKAYLVRNKKEEYSIMLNEDSRNKAYVLGRAFAVLEMIQKKASSGDLNATIKDKYFATACSNPSLVFPTLLKLSHHHLAKIEGKYWEKKLSDVLALVEGESFSKTQSMEQQGSFILGYYQQTQKLYEKQNKETIGNMSIGK